MNPALAQAPDALRVNLTVPTTQVRLGPLSFDGLQAFLGVPLADLLSPLMGAPRHQRPARPAPCSTCTRWRSPTARA